MDIRFSIFKYLTFDDLIKTGIKFGNCYSFIHVNSLLNYKKNFPNINFKSLIHSFFLNNLNYLNNSNCLENLSNVENIKILDAVHKLKKIKNMKFHDYKSLFITRHNNYYEDNIERYAPIDINFEDMTQFSSLKELKLYSIILKLDSINFNNLTKLSMIDNQISEFHEINCLMNLRYLNLKKNMIKSLSDGSIPKSVVELNVSENLITRFVGCPNTIKKLNISHNKLLSFLNCPQTIKELDVSYNKIKKFKKCPKNLTKFSFHNNLITSFEECPDVFTELNISTNCLESWDYFPKKCKILNIVDNNINIDLNKLPVDIIIFGTTTKKKDFIYKYSKITNEISRIVWR